MRVVVNELLRLWYQGALIPTPRFPDGRRVRVILVGVFCDKPAAHKVGGFGSHCHNFFCTLDWITQAFKGTVEAFTRGGKSILHYLYYRKLTTPFSAFAPRTNHEHRTYMAQYRACRTPAAREEHARRTGTRWSELARLPYFDMCQMIAVDPMHNLFLGQRD